MEPLTAARCCLPPSGRQGTARWPRLPYGHRCQSATAAVYGRLHPRAEPWLQGGRMIRTQLPQCFSQRGWHTKTNTTNTSNRKETCVLARGRNPAAMLEPLWKEVWFPAILTKSWRVSDYSGHTQFFFYLWRTVLNLRWFGFTSDLIQSAFLPGSTCPSLMATSRWMLPSCKHFGTFIQSAPVAT